MTDRDFHSYTPREGHRLPHDPLNALVAPRPIGWIGTVSKDRVRNLAPYSFFNAFNYIPPIIGFASTGWKDSARNIAETGVFTWNLATRPLAERMNLSCAAVGPEVDEFALAGLTPLASETISAPRVAESPVSFECRLTQQIRLQTAEGDAVDTWLTLGEAVRIHIAQDLLKDGIYQTAAADPILRGGGPSAYFTISDAASFHMRRPVT